MEELRYLPEVSPALGTVDSGNLQMFGSSSQITAWCAQPRQAGWCHSKLRTILIKTDSAAVQSHMNVSLLIKDGIVSQPTLTLACLVLSGVTVVLCVVSAHLQGSASQCSSEEHLGLWRIYCISWFGLSLQRVEALTKAQGTMSPWNSTSIAYS